MDSKDFKKLTPRSIKAWQWGNAFSNLFFFAIPALYFIFSYNNLNIWILSSLIAIVGVYWVLSIVWIPYLQWKKWRYSIDSNEIDLVRGVIVKTETLIPINRVQHVDTRQGPLLRWFNLASVTISTAATTHIIPSLDEVIANRVRDQISTNARLAKEDV